MKILLTLTPRLVPYFTNISFHNFFITHEAQTNENDLR